MPVPLLSICIATLERADCLRETLASIVPQLATDEVELLVVDGASADHTGAVVEAATAQSARVRYLRLAAKGGVDRDYDAGLRAARGTYCWFFCDDDLLVPDAVECVLAALKAYRPDLLVVDGMTWLAERDEILVTSRLRLQTDRSFASGQAVDLFRAVAHHVSYIGAVVVRREMWLARAHAPYVGSEFAHVGVIFQAPMPGVAVALARPLIRIRFMNHTWAPRAFRIWMRNWPELIWSFDWIPEAERRRVVARRPWRNTLMLLAQRAKGDYGEGAFRACIVGHEPSAWHRALAYVVARVPARPLRGMALLVLRVFSFVPRFRVGAEALSRDVRNPP